MYDTTKPYKGKILELIKETWETPYVSIKKDIYPIIKKKFQYGEVDHTDGIGTKGVYHWKQRTFKNAVLDALAMNLNDLILSRATPYKLQNHIFIPKDDDTIILEIVKILSQECKKRNIAITGGETSIHNNTNCMDISMTISGFIKNYLPNIFQVGDILIGVRSNGLHSNGFTKVREIFMDEYKEDFTKPTEIYYKEISDLEKQMRINGMMHITGGSYTKLKDVMQGTDVKINRNHKLNPQEIFNELYSKGISDEEVYRTFNCGIGFIFSVSQEDISKVNLNLEWDVIGKLKAGTGKVKLESMFSEREIEF